MGRRSSLAWVGGIPGSTVARKCAGSNSQISIAVHLEMRTHPLATLIIDTAGGLLQDLLSSGRQSAVFNERSGLYPTDSLTA
jgi:hypothetical protein